MSLQQHLKVPMREPIRKCLAALALFLLVSPGALGAAAAPKRSAGSGATRSDEKIEPGSPIEASEVVRRVNMRDDGQHLSRKVTILAIDKKGNERKREAMAYRRYTEAGKQSLIRYTEPASMRGTAFLTYDYSEPGRADDQWLYLPAQRRARRVSAAERGSSFLGTDFTYENVKNETKITTEDYDWSTLGWQATRACECILIEGVAITPKIAKELGHSRTLRWIDSATWLTHKIEYYDEAGEKLKTITASDITEIEGIWTARRLTCRNHSTGGSSVFLFSDHDYGTELGGDLFTQDALRRATP